MKDHHDMKVFAKLFQQMLVLIILKIYNYLFGRLEIAYNNHKLVMLMLYFNYL